MGRQMGFYERKVCVGGGRRRDDFFNLGHIMFTCTCRALVGVKRHTTILSTVVGVA